MYEIINQLCKERKISITKLCEMVTNSSGNLATWKKGYMRSDYLQKIADYFGVSVDYLLGRTDEPQKINYGVENHGDNNGAINNQVNSANTPDGISKEMLVKFEELNFIDKVKVMSLIAELSEKKD